MKSRTYHVVNMWQVPLEKEIMNKDTCDEIIDELMKTNNGPWPDNQLDFQAPITAWEEMVAIFSLLIIMGGPLFWFLILTPIVFIFGTLHHKISFVITTLVLAFHPLPTDRDTYSRSYIVKCWYKYFSYRFVWCDNARTHVENNAPFIGGGVPHGVMPFANLLSIPAINATTTIDFVGCPASVVFRTPFLRYVTLFGCTDVGKKNLTKCLNNEQSVGLVADGIAGIFYSNHDDEVVNLLHRKGVAKLALELGKPILPCYSFGNTTCFTAVHDSYGIMERISRKLQASIFIYWGQWGLPIPRRTNITMVVGTLIQVKKTPNPTQQDIDRVHAQYLDGIREIFDLHKASLGLGHMTIKFV